MVLAERQRIEQELKRAAGLNAPADAIPFTARRLVAFGRHEAGALAA